MHVRRRGRALLSIIRDQRRAVGLSPSGGLRPFLSELAPAGRSAASREVTASRAAGRELIVFVGQQINWTRACRRLERDPSDGGRVIAAAARFHARFCHAAEYAIYQQRPARPPARPGRDARRLPAALNAGETAVRALVGRRRAAACH